MTELPDSTILELLRDPTAMLRAGHRIIPLPPKGGLAPRVLAASGWNRLKERKEWEAKG